MDRLRERGSHGAGVGCSNRRPDCPARRPSTRSLRAILPGRDTHQRGERRRENQITRGCEDREERVEDEHLLQPRRHDRNGIEDGARDPQEERSELVEMRRVAKKRADYFAAGTLAVWDVNLLSEDVVKSYSIYSPDVPRIFRRGDIADAEPGVSGWSMPVDDLFVDRIE